MTRRALFTLFVLLPGIALARQDASPIDGVWRISEVVTTGANAATNTSPQPSLIIFTRGHYSWVAVGSAKPRPDYAPAKDPQKLTDAEKIARFEQWNPFTAQSGTFTVKGSTLTRRPSVAKNNTVMASSANPIVQEFKVDGNTLTLVARSAQGQPASETRTRLTRVR